MKKILTIVLDGFGYREDAHGNAIKDADMQFFNKIWEEYPHSLLKASEEAVGLNEGEFGNSETGHMTIGAGRKIKQHGTIVHEFVNSDLSKNENFLELLQNKDKDIHLMGLCSDGHVHSSIDDTLKFYKILVNNGFKKIHFHIITDGRDTESMISRKFIKMIVDTILENKVGDIATICGRYYAMDRDKNYERTKKYYDLVTIGKGIHPSDLNKTINDFYEKGITDEFLEPILVNKKGLIKNGDIVIWTNFREDRAKQIISSFVNDDFEGFSKNVSNVTVYSFMKIDNNIPTISFASEEVVNNPLGIYLSKLGITQARIAETEKFPHVTYFFDGGYLGKKPKCNEFQLPSPKVATYDLKPEMSAVLVTKKIVECMVQDYDFIFANFANADMVGHTGVYDATVKACMALDLCLQKIVEKAEENFYKVIILADHGNADIMLDEEDKPVTTHTLSLVPFIIMDKNVELKSEGDLTMVAPTILEYMDIAVPEEMKDTNILLK